jgi:NADH-quinone oxidoreductase subunit L
VAGLLAVLPRSQRQLAASLSVGAMVFGFLLACCAFAVTLQEPGYREVVNFAWLQMGETTLDLGWVLDPLTAAMLMMITFVGALIFVFSVGYMVHDTNFKQFFCFLSLFAAAMLGLVIANSLLLLFMCWELVGLASYLLIGFWHHKPSAAAAAKKAFITTRIGDVFFFLGILWLYRETGTLLFYADGAGCLEQDALTALAGKTLLSGMAVSTAISLLLFCGAMGKSGQVPLHVWLPDAMEGPTPVSALIHAATMVAAGVFLIARVYPLLAVGGAGAGGTAALQVVTWVGAITAVFAALIAVAQTDIKRILAYSTVSQLGFMFMGLGMGGVAVGMFHLITHAFFKALLFLGAGSVIHGCHEEQDIRRMGGLRKFMPVTFATYAVGMMALAGVPLFFSGFWSKDEILHAAHAWQPSHWPFYLGLFGAFLTAFYMTRQMLYVFFGKRRTGVPPVPLTKSEHAGDHRKSEEQAGRLFHVPHESPWIMTAPLVVLAVCAVLLGFFGTPAWPWFQSYLNGVEAHAQFGHLFEKEVLGTMLLSTLIVAAGLWAGWRLYRNAGEQATGRDTLEQAQPAAFAALRGKFFVDEFYELSVIALNRWWARVCDWLDRVVWDGLVKLVSLAVVALSWVNRLFDEFVINLGFDKACGRVRQGGEGTSRWQGGQVQSYLRVIGIALVVFVLALTWGCGAS